VLACAAALPGEHLVQEHADDLAEQADIAGEQKPHLTRQRQHPLAVRTVGRTRSTSWTAVSAIRRLMHDGQNPRGLHENATSRCVAQASHRTRTKPWQIRPQARNFSNSRFTKHDLGLEPGIGAVERDELVQVERGLGAVDHRAVAAPGREIGAAQRRARGGLIEKDVGARVGRSAWGALGRVVVTRAPAT